MTALRAVLLLTLLAAPLGAQTASKRPLTQSDYDVWRSIHSPRLSDDGRWLVYSLVPQVGDGEVVVRATQGRAEYRAPRGFIGRPQLEAGADSGWSPPPAQITPDGRWVAYLIFAPRDSFERAQRAKRKDRPKASLGVLNTATGVVDSVPRVKSFRLAEESGRWLVYLLERPDSSAEAPRDTTPPATPAVAAAPGGTPRPVADSATKEKPPKKDLGSTLVIRDLQAGTEARLEDVLAYAIDDSGRTLVYTRSTKDGTGDGVFVRTLADATTRALTTGAGKYESLTLDESGTRAAFVSDRAEHGREKPQFALYLAELRSGDARAVVSPDSTGDDLLVSEHARVSFTEDGSAILFGVAPVGPDSIPADSLADKAVFDLWHWRDARLQPQQRVEARRDRRRAYDAIYHVEPRRYVRLGSDTLLDVDVSDDGRVALAVTRVPYSVSAMWGEGGADVWAIDARTGERTLVADRVEFGANLSPDGKYVLWFEDGRWLAYEMATRRTADLTGALADVRFDRETWDTPSTPAPWGVAGWTSDDASVLLYDRWDVWQLDPSGQRPPVMVTDSLGRREGIVFRVVDLDEEDDHFDPRESLLLRALDDETKASGFWRERLGSDRDPERIVMADRRFGNVEKAEDAEVYVVSQSTFREFPNLWVGPSLTRLTRVTDANPQQSRYAWGTAELVRWRDADGHPLTGLLYKPEGFDPGRQYPMIVYFYEQLSDNLHQYHQPFGRNVINPTVYTSLGYLVFFPDIHYTNGYPGPSAVKSIVPGVLALIDEGFVDPEAVGIAGQSWGGYQTAYIITQTDLFAAAVPNAPVANMTSAYGGIRWGSGLARAFQYEKTQSRIGGSPWEYPERYIENSPLFYLDRVNTPVLFMHNDADGAVPWYQGIELFVGLRRLGKEVYFVNYNGDAHNPTKRANQLDIDKRMQQFFAHHLLGAPAPAWMREGIPFLAKGRDQITPANQEQPIAPEPVANEPR